VRVLLPAAQELLTVSSVNAVVVALKATETTDEVAGRLRRQLDPARFDVLTWPELADFYGKTVALYRRQFAVLQAIILIAVLLSVANSVNVTVFERTGEFGTLRALGNRARSVFALIVTENAILGIVGGAAGCAVGAILAWTISAIGIPMPPPPNSDVGYIAKLRITGTDLAAGMAIGVMATTLASLLPARRATRIEVVDALRQN
jgi:putative ABC transport system permease protein